MSSDEESPDGDMSDTSPSTARLEKIVGATASTVTMVVCGIVTIALLARFLGVSGVGTYVFAFAIAHSVGRIPAGFGGAIKKQIRTSDTHASEYFGVGLLLTVLAFFVALTGLILTTGLYSERLAMYGVSLRLVTGVTAVIVAQGLFYMTHSVYTSASTGRWVKSVRTVLVLIIHAALLMNGFGVPALLFGYAGVTFLLGVGLFPYTPVSPATPRPRAFISVFRSAMWSVPSAFASNFHHTVDVLVIGLVVGFSAVGKYEAALRVVIPGMLVSGLLSDIMSRDLHSESAHGISVSSTIQKATTYAGVGAIPLVALVAVLGQPTLTAIYGVPFGDAWVPLLLLAGIQVIAAYRVPYSMALRSLSFSRKVFWIRFVSFLVNIPLSVFLATRHGVLGAIIATAIVEVLTLLAYYAYLRSLIDRTINLQAVSGQFVSAAIAFGSVAGAIHLGYLSSSSSYLLAIGTGFLLYFIVFISLSTRTRTWLIKTIWVE